MDEISPWLPPEIEHHIFLLAFHNDSKGQTTLLRVAKRVFEWVTPLLYDTIMILEVSTKSYPSLTTLQRHGRHVHHLFVDVMARNHEESDFIPRLLPLCPNIFNLAMWFGRISTLSMPDIVALPLRRLAIDHFGFLGDIVFDNDPPNAKLVQWCSKITHLAIGCTLSSELKRRLSYFPALEYLMIFRGDDLCGFIAEALTRCRNLKVVVELLGSVSDGSKTQIAPDTHEYPDIRRVIVDGYFVSDWYRGRQGLGDLWDVAEMEVEKRRGLFARLCE